MSPSAEIIKISKKLGIGSIQKHIFLCIGDKCCSAEAGMKTWEWLKGRTREADMTSLGVYRTKVGCLRICREGPIALVYPDGIWYHSVTPEVCERIVTEHILGGKPVEEYRFATNPLD